MPNTATRSLWDTEVQLPEYPALSGEHTADVVIVGGGLTGITAALLLAEAGKQVIVLEAKQIGTGVTGGTTAHITAILDTGYQTITSDFGAEGAKLAAESHLAAIEQVAGLVTRHGIACNFERVTGWLYSENGKDEAQLRKELKAMQDAGLTATWVAQPSLPLPAKYAIKVDNQAQFHPLKYLVALANAAAARGVRFFQNAHVSKITENSGGGRVETQGGAVTASDVFLATHIPPGLSIVDTEVAPYRSYVVACKMQGDKCPAGLFWDTEDPYHYTRVYEQGGTCWLIVGGKDHKTGQCDDTRERFTALETYVRERFGIVALDYRWSAQVYEPVDGLAYIGKSPGSNHVYYATGYSGNGMTYANIAARLVTHQITGQENRWTNLYSPARIKPGASVVDYIKENVNAVSRLVGDRLKGTETALDEVAPGQGEVVRVDGQQVAAYRDPEGNLHTLSPVCPHMKCIVQWNTAEKTWDCPCHGGRFTPTGEHIEGPPQHNLDPIDLSEKAQTPPVSGD